MEILARMLESFLDGIKVFQLPC